MGVGLQVVELVQVAVIVDVFPARGADHAFGDAGFVILAGDGLACGGFTSSLTGNIAPSIIDDLSMRVGCLSSGFMVGLRWGLTHNWTSVMLGLLPDLNPMTDLSMPKPPKYRSIARRLQQEIVAGAYLPGQPMPSEQAMADSYGVNRLTLRKALTVLEAEKLVTRKHGCGTFANPAAERREQARVFFVGETKTHFYGSFYAALCSEAEGLGKAVISCGIGNVEQREALTEMLSGQSSVICMHNHWQRLRDLVPANCRVVLVSGFHSLRRETITGAPNHVVSTDTFHGAMYAVEHLLALGHRQIALLDTAAGDAAMVKAQGFGPVIDSMPTCQGYRAALRQAGLGQEYLIGIPNLESESEEAATDSASQALFRYLEASSTIPSAYLCVGDFRAVAAYRALRQFGLRVPDDVSVIGMGNTPWCTCLDPQLTSVCLGEVELARTALLLSAGTSPAGGRLLRVDPHVVNRNSTARHTV